MKTVTGKPGTVYVDVNIMKVSYVTNEFCFYFSTCSLSQIVEDINEKLADIQEAIAVLVL